MVLVYFNGFCGELLMMVVVVVGVLFLVFFLFLVVCCGCHDGARGGECG